MIENSISFETTGHKKTMSVNEFSSKYGIGMNYCYKLIKSNSFPMIRVGRKILIISDLVDDWISRNIGKTIN